MNRLTWLFCFAIGCGSSSQQMMMPGGGGTGGVGGGGGGGGSGASSLKGATFGTYIVLGDSISDRGGTGPFFYDLLHDQLSAKFPNLMYVHGAQAGAITDAYSDTGGGAPTLKSQIDALGSSHPGDVLVTITIGGNDLNGHAVQAIGGTDQQAQMELKSHLTDELGALATPGRLGSGKVYIVLANIYDFSDGQGDFRTIMCGPPINVAPARVTATFGAWNGILSDAIGAAHGTLYDLHGDFMGHGFNATDVWYDRSSCLHPNTTGHAHIAQSLWSMISG